MAKSTGFQAFTPDDVYATHKIYASDAKDIAGVLGFSKHGGWTQEQVDAIVQFVAAARKQKLTVKQAIQAIQPQAQAQEKEHRGGGRDHESFDGFATPFEATDTSGLELEFDQSLMQLEEAAQQQQQQYRVAELYQEVFEEEAGEDVLREQIRRRLQLIKLGALNPDPNNPYEVGIAQLRQQIAKKPRRAHNLTVQNGRVVMKLNLQQLSPQEVLALTAVKAQNGGLLPPTIARLPQVGGVSINGTTQIPAPFQALLPAQPQE